ncbi:hypothetical protein GGC64_006337 [Mycobacterium sp. OAS707]|uniref:hypothetical protein n=1 Tax=Mycobacterium sp. OAS707 TaxID=2663822 RepID=UPI00178A8B23|nr:hypothetical protein [Mycobacterium sp. OAS707]MBE1552250.1 hypothetical protein [Mycobacterium sp. OAS707]
MKTCLIATLAGVGVALCVAPSAQAECCEGGFDWGQPYVDALRNHDLGYLVDSRGIPVTLAAEAVCKGPSAYGIADDYQIGLATAEQVARAVYMDVCLEMAP